MNRCSAEHCRWWGGRIGRGRFPASLLDSVHGEVAEVEAERTKASSRALVAGADGRCDGGERRKRGRSSARVRVFQGPRGSKE